MQSILVACTFVIALGNTIVQQVKHISSPLAQAPKPTTYSLRPTMPLPTKKTIPTPQVAGVSTSWEYPFSKKDDPSTIAEWYKTKIRSLGYNVNNFVSTKANEKVLIKLVGANSTEKISIQISKNSPEEDSKIDISLDKM